MNINWKKTLQLGSLAIFFLIIIIYAIFGARSIISGVKIKNVNITDGETFKNPITIIKGTAKNAIDLRLDGREISIDQDGNFNETIALLPGYNIINIKARDKFGYSDEKNYQVIYKNND
jgi:hypothetical protein